MPFIPRFETLGFSGMFYKFYMINLSPTNHENATYSPSPLTGEGQGGGGQVGFTPHLSSSPARGEEIFSVIF
jgi:hypothetical protein